MTAPFERTTVVPWVLDKHGNVLGFQNNDRFIAIPSYEMSVKGTLLGIKSPNGIINDGVALYDVTASASANSVMSSASANFTSADVGKSCAIIPYTDSGLTPRWGTISAVTSATSIITSLSASPGALSNATLIYGTDNGDILDAILAAAEGSVFKGRITLPPGIIVSTKQHTVASGVILEGAGNNPTGGKAKDFKHYGTSLVLTKNYDSGGFITLGSTGPSDPRGSYMQNLNVDCMNLSVSCVSGEGSRTNHVFGCTLVRGKQETFKGGPTSRLLYNMIMGQNAYNVVQVGGDSTVAFNNITGAGNGYYGVKTGNGDDISIVDNHIWKDSSASTMLGGSVWISHFSGVSSGSVSILNNRLDTNYGSAVKVTISGGSTKVRSIKISNNDAFNNDAVSNNTGPVIELSVAAGCSLRAFAVVGNTGRGSWNNESLGQWSAFIDGSAIAGNIYGSVVGGNVIANCNALFASFSPDHDFGNVSIAGTGNALTKSTTT